MKLSFQRTHTFHNTKVFIESILFLSNVKLFMCSIKLFCQFRMFVRCLLFGCCCFFLLYYRTRYSRDTFDCIFYCHIVLADCCVYDTGDWALVVPIMISTESIQSFLIVTSSSAKVKSLPHKNTKHWVKKRLKMASSQKHFIANFK